MSDDMYWTVTVGPVPGDQAELLEDYFAKRFPKSRPAKSPVQLLPDDIRDGEPFNLLLDHPLQEALGMLLGGHAVTFIWHPEP